jgi:EAL domain-containing protein (putative c-di-GMP-specific phosphodiesterase class I)
MEFHMATIIHSDPQAAAETLPIQDLLSLRFAMAFQPIVDLARKEVFAYEALARGINGEPAATVFARVEKADEYAFDHVCRARAIRVAARLGMNTCLSLNFLPNAIYHPKACIRKTLHAARQMQFPVDRIIFEITEIEPVGNVAHLAAIIREYQREGFRTAIDDFGAGYSGLGLLAELRPDFVKIDIGLTHGIGSDHVRRVIVKGIMATCRSLAIEVIAEGVETIGEMNALRDLGVRYFQGFLFARPGLETLPAVQWPEGLEPCEPGPANLSRAITRVKKGTQSPGQGKDYP